MKLFEIENNKLTEKQQSQINFIEENFDIYLRGNKIDKFEINTHLSYLKPSNFMVSLKIKENKKLKKLPFEIYFHNISLTNCGLESIENISGYMLDVSDNQNLPSLLNSDGVFSLIASNTNIQKIIYKHDYDSVILHEVHLDNCANLESIDLNSKIMLLNIVNCPMLKNFDFSKIDNMITDQTVFDEFLFKENQSLQISVLMKTIPVLEEDLEKFFIYTPLLKEFLKKIIKTDKSTLQKNIIKNLNELWSNLD